MEANIFNLITTGILALAAILAYLVQRARYLREIEPALELKWPNSIRVVRMSSNLKEGWAFYIDIEVENRSKNHAEGLRYDVDLEIFPQRGKLKFLEQKIPDILPSFHPDKVLAERRVVIPIYIDSIFAPKLQEKLNSWDSSLNLAEAGFIATVTISYFSRRELVLYALLIPQGKIKYTREICTGWRFQIDEKARPPYASQPWEPGERGEGD